MFDSIRLGFNNRQNTLLIDINGLNLIRKFHFILDFLEIDWNSSFESCDNKPNPCFNTFDPKIKGLLDQHLPTEKLTKKQLVRC